MEMFLNTLYNSSAGNLIKVYAEGSVRPWFSLEIASFGGDVRFFIRTQAFHKRLVLAQFYAQYPDIELVEVDDYTTKVPYGKPDSDWSLWGAEFKFEKDDAYPIKTYMDYGLTDDIKEEQKVDPMTHFLEYMGSIKEGEQIWYQILVQATRKRFNKPGTWFKREDWKAQGEALIEKLMKRGQKQESGDDKKIDFGAMLLSPGERVVVEAIERSISKLGFDVGIRGVYLARKDSFDFLGS